MACQANRPEAFHDICYSHEMTVVRLFKPFSASFSVLLSWSLFCSPLLLAQRSAQTTDPPATSRAEFVKAADKVLQDMSEITGLSQVSPVKKTLRSRPESAAARSLSA